MACAEGRTDDDIRRPTVRRAGPRPACRRTARCSPRCRAALGFGLGFETVDRLGASNFASEGTFGWSGAYGTLYKVDPAERLVMVLMIQVVPYFGSGIRESFDAAVYHALVEPAQSLP